MFYNIFLMLLAQLVAECLKVELQELVGLLEEQLVELLEEQLVELLEEQLVELPEEQLAAETYLLVH